MPGERPNVVHRYHAEDERGAVLVHPGSEAPYNILKTPSQIDDAEYIALPRTQSESTKNPNDFTFYTETPEGRDIREAAERDPDGELFPIRLRSVGNGSYKEYVNDATRKDLSEKDRDDGTIYFPVPQTDPDPDELFPH